MSEAQNLSWSLEAERTCRVRSPWWELVWHPVRGLTEVAFASGGTSATQGLVAPEPGNREAKPAQAVSGGAWKAPAILGLSQLRIGDRCWQLGDLPTAEIVIQENRITASWPARSDCPVELHARWVLEACRFWLEVSLLTRVRSQTWRWRPSAIWIRALLSRRLTCMLPSEQPCCDRKPCPIGPTWNWPARTKLQGYTFHRRALCLFDFSILLSKKVWFYERGCWLRSSAGRTKPGWCRKSLASLRKHRLT
jgi:hypothetical protein